MCSPNCRRFFPTPQDVVGQVVALLTKDSPLGQVVGIVPVDDAEQVLERCCILPIFDPNAQHDRLVERIEPLWTSENVRGGLLQIEADVRIPLTVYQFKIGGVLLHDVMEIFFCPLRALLAEFVEVLCCEPVIRIAPQPRA